MELRDVIRARQSTRAFLDKPICDNLIYDAIELAKYAPSAGNQQAYRTIIVRDKRIKELLYAASARQDSIIGAPVIIVVCSEPQRSERRYGERGRNIYSIHDAVIFAAYIQLALVDLGLSSVWIGAFRQRKVMEILEITDKDLLPVAIIPIGYGLDSSLKGKHRRKLVEILYP